MTTLEAQTLPSIGTPVYRRGEVGYISRVLEGKPGSFVIGANMRPIANEFEVCFETHTSVVPDGIAAPWLARAAEMGLAAIPAEEIETKRANVLDIQAAARRASMAAQEESARLAAAFKIEAAAKMPSDAKAVIVAELISDRSDSMTDYWGSTTTRTVILAFSTHTRDLFPELRKAALNFAETAELYDAPEKAEHREKYSMGAGFYLKSGSRDSDGWKIKKHRLYSGADSIPVGEWSLSPVAAAPEPEASAPAAIGGHAIEEHTHTKGGFQMWVVTMGERVEREEYDRLLTAAKALGGWYSRKWGTTPAGFAFKSEDAARTFAAPDAPSTPDVAQASTPKVAANTGTAEKLRGMADKLQTEIDHKLGDRLTNTPKRQREAASARLDGHRLQRTQQAMRALAGHYDAGTVPADLRGVTTKAAIFDLTRTQLETGGGYYDAPRCTGRPAVDSPASRALWAMIEGRSEEDKAADDLRDKVGKLQFANIPGYFPTPAPIVAQMIEAADICDDCTVLEPEAGSGAILDQVREAALGARLVAFERHASLREILRLKGYELAGSDFMESDAALKVGRVLMNPPFENGQDMAHVMRAFGHLEPGGRLVAIMSPGPFFRQDSKASAFRAWFEHHGGEKTDLPAGAFKESGTGVATVLVVIDA